MRRPSARLTPNTVTVSRVTFGQDAAGGRAVTATPQPQSYAVSIHPTSAAVKSEHLREQGVQYFTVHFYDDPDLRVRDEVVDSLGRRLVVVSPRGPSGGVRRSWPVDCEYRSPASGY